jgi:ABC-type cobalamin/Fe3+-siderophores transport system ATPase subunit
LVLLDEPTANLDSGYQVEMFRLLRQLAKSEKARMMTWGARTMRR